MDKPRLIEVAFPLKQTSLDSVHEKNVRHGHISTLHIWPARRPLAASRAALIATLLPDPGDDDERREILKRMAGEVREVRKQKTVNGKIEEEIKEETVGGILHWGRESGPDLEWFRQKIREAYGGRAPKVLDPFAGGGAIPLEAMRLGCEVTAADINPVAWFILKCTLEYPQKLAGQLRPLPEFILKNEEFMADFRKSKGVNAKSGLSKNRKGKQPDASFTIPMPFDFATDTNADLAWHVRAWGWWVLQRAKADLERYYPVIDGKPTVAYLWARTVTCKNCRATIPLLKTRWLCKKPNKRVLLTMQPNADKTGVIFGVQNDVPEVNGSTGVRKEHDRKLGAGTMSRVGATCPCCSVIMTSEDIRIEGQSARLGVDLTTVVVEGSNGKDYRLPTLHEINVAIEARLALEPLFQKLPFGIPNEPTPAGGGGAARAFSVQGYGMFTWDSLFTPRQLLAAGTLSLFSRDVTKMMERVGYEPSWINAVVSYLALAANKTIDYNSSICTWHMSGEKIRNTFVRFGLSITWDFCEIPVTNQVGAAYFAQLEWISLFVQHALNAVHLQPLPVILQKSAIQTIFDSEVDVIVTDPPYYDAIPYSDAMDFFYIWLKRTLFGIAPETYSVFDRLTSPKWDHESNDGELIDDSSRFEGNKSKSKNNYEDGMARAFQACHKALKSNGRLVIVFAHKHPDAWETLVMAVMRSGFIVDGSWPIQTEMGNRTRAISSAALSSSVWLVCKKRPETARPGWDNIVLDEMRSKITQRLRDFWDAGIRGPDFVWAATGPAMEAYSRYPAVRKANQAGELMSVSEFLGHVRRMVVDFVVGRVLSSDKTAVHGTDDEAAGLDEITTYYLLHRNDFGMVDAPIGACILYAVSCGLSDRALADQFDLLVRGSSASTERDSEEDESAEDEEVESVGSGSTIKLKAWQARKRKTLGYDAPGGRAVPIIDQIHRLMHLWKAGDVTKVDDYINERSLRSNALFAQVLQSLIELAAAGSEERALLESISNYLAARGTRGDAQQKALFSE